MDPRATLHIEVSPSVGKWCYCWLICAASSDILYNPTLPYRLRPFVFVMSVLYHKIRSVLIFTSLCSRSDSFCSDSVRCYQHNTEALKPIYVFWNVIIEPRWPSWGKPLVSTGSSLTLNLSLVPVECSWETSLLDLIMSNWYPYFYLQIL